MEKISDCGAISMCVSCGFFFVGYILTYLPTRAPVSIWKPL